MTSTLCIVSRPRAIEDFLLLRPQLQALLVEVETLAQASLCWDGSSEIGGAMCSLIENGVPTIRYRELSEAGVAEELMHLRLALFGLQLSYPANRHLIAQTATLLQNVVHHHVIYPVLIEWGYQPSISECKSIAKQLLALEDSSDLARTTTDPELEALMATLYARGQLDCGDTEVISRLEHVFSAEALNGARQLGNRLISSIQNQTDPTPGACRETLVACLKVLGLSNMITISPGHA